MQFANEMCPALTAEPTTLMSSKRGRRLRKLRHQSDIESLSSSETEDSEAQFLQENLWDAVNMGYTDIIKEIQHQGINPNFIHEEYGCAPLHVAVENGDMHVVKVLLSQDSCFVDIRDQYGQTAFMHATILDDVETMKTLYRAGADIDAEDKSGKTAFLLGLQDACKDASKYLLRLGCDVNVVDRLGQSALYLLLNSMDMDVIGIVKKLIKKGYNVEQDKMWLQEEGMDVETVRTSGFFPKLMKKLGSKVSIFSCKSEDSHRTVYAESACGHNRIRILKVQE